MYVCILYIYIYICTCAVINSAIWYTRNEQVSTQDSTNITIIFFRDCDSWTCWYTPSVAYLYNKGTSWKLSVFRVVRQDHIQGGAEPTDTFQMVINNIWKQGKISETVYKYVQVCYLLPTDYKLIFWKLHRADGLCLHQCIVASVSGRCRTRASVGPHQ